MRLIDADVFKKDLENQMELLFDTEIAELIDNQPTISQWIPVSERLPKHEELALVSALSYNENKAFVDILKMSNGKWYVFEPFCGWEEVYCDIIAWMPLPKPYIGDDK